MYGLFIWGSFSSPQGDSASSRMRASLAPTHSFSPTTSPTFVVPVVVLYLSQRLVRGDFMTRETPEQVCEEGAHAKYSCERVTALVSTASTPMRRRVREMKGVMVSFGHDHAVVAHDVADLWVLELGLPEQVWTGTDQDGGVGEDRCKDWTTVDGYGVYGERGMTDGDARCSESKRLLCVCKSKL